MEGIKKALTEIERTPQQSDLIVGFISLCKTLKNLPDQVYALNSCADVLLLEHPILALKLMKLVLLLDPEDPIAREALLDVLKRRGRWVTERRLAELKRTTLHTAATSPVDPDFSVLKPDSETHESTFSRQNKLKLHESTRDSVLREPKIVPENSIEQQNRVEEYLSRCGFDPSLVRYAQGMSCNNCGLVTFVGLLQRLGLVKSQDMHLALIMLRKMMDENPDNSEAMTLYKQMFEPVRLMADREE